MKHMLNSRGLLVALSMAAMLSSSAFSQTKKGGNMSGENKVLVAYFSATGTTAGIARAIADGCGGTLCEIKPVKPYTDADLNWHDKKSRTTIECNDKSFRCPMQPFDANIADYDIILVGFPIWWYGAPSIIQTFLESADFKGKRIALFCTSGGSGLGNTQNVLKKSAAGATWLGGKRFSGGDTKGAAAWAKQVVEE